MPSPQWQFFHAVGKEKRGERGEKKGEREKGRREEERGRRREGRDRRLDITPGTRPDRSLNEL